MKAPILLALTLLLATAAFGQGLLTPPASPEPTKKSLQEIWDKVGGLETQVTTVQAQITALKNQNSTLQTQLTQFRPDNQLLTSTGDYDGAGVSDVAEFKLTPMHAINCASWISLASRRFLPVTFQWKPSPSLGPADPTACTSSNTPTISRPGCVLTGPPKSA